MEDREVKKVVCEELHVIKLGVKDVCDTIMCEYSDAQLNDASASTISGVTDDHRPLCMAQEHAHTCIATKIKRCKCFFPCWVKDPRPQLVQE